MSGGAALQRAHARVNVLAQHYKPADVRWRGVFVAVRYQTHYNENLQLFRWSGWPAFSERDH